MGSLEVKPIFAARLRLLASHAVRRTGMRLGLLLPVIYVGLSSTCLAQGVLEKTAGLGPTTTSYVFRCSGGGSTTCQAQCAPKETLISGGCAVASGAGVLQNAGVTVAAMADQLSSAPTRLQRTSTLRHSAQ